MRNSNIVLRNISLILFIICSFALNAQVSFRASAPTTVANGEMFRLTFTLNTEGQNLQLPDGLNNFDVLFGPATSQSSSTQIVNGKVSSNSSVSYTYTLLPKKTGTFKIGAASISVGGRVYRSNSLIIKVVAGSSNGGGASANAIGEPSRPSGNGKVRPGDAFIRAIVSKNSVYEQEGFTVTFRLYTTLNVQNFGKIEFPEFEGFMVEEVPLSGTVQLTREKFSGKTYYAADLRKTLLFPQRSGKMTIPAGKIEMIFSVPSGRSVESFFGNQEINVDVTKVLTTNPVTIDVKSLPAPKPASFKNAVGQFSLTPSINTKGLRANEPVTLVLQISGTGNLKLIQNPTVKFPSSFETDEPVVNVTPQITTNGVTGFRKIEYTAIPKYEGNFTIPPVEFTYFDLSTKSYKTLRTPSYDLKVAKGDPNKSRSSNYGDDEEKLDKDIRGLFLSEPNFVSRNEAFVGSIGYVLLYVIPLLLFATYYFFRKRKSKESSNVVLMRTKHANKVAVKRLRTAEKYLASQQKEPFYDELLKALWGYFSDKLSIPLSSLNKETIESRLSNVGINDVLIQRFMNILNTAEFAQYAPVESDHAMNDLYNETVDAIGQMENQLKNLKYENDMKRYKLFTLILFSLLTAFQEVCGQDLNQQAIDAYKKGDYKTSISIFESQVKNNLTLNSESAEVYYNLGNAYFKNGQTTQAILNYERALILKPSDKNIKHNLRFARTRVEDKSTVTDNVVWNDTRNSVVNLFSAYGWGIFGIVFFLITLILLGIYLFANKLWMRKTGFYGMFLTLLIVVLANYFAFTQRNNRIHRSTAIVTTPIAEVKPSPDANSKPLLNLSEGIKVKIKDTDGNWVQIELANGNLGWLPKDNITVI